MHGFPLGKKEEGATFNEEWEYIEVVGMLMHIFFNTWPDMAYSVNQCKWFTHNLKVNNSIGLIEFQYCLRGTHTKGRNIQPTNQYDVHCYVDAYFVGFDGS